MAKRRSLAYVALDELVPAERNAKGHDAGKIAASMLRFGYIEPIVVDERTGRLVAGHGRREDLLARRAAGEPAPEGVVVRAGVWTVPVVQGWASRDDADAEAAGIALNRTVEAGGWDSDELTAMLQDLANSPAGLEGVGFDPADLDMLQAQAAKRAEPPEPDPVPAVPKKILTKRGDVWLLGDHRILCGDCRAPADVERALDGRTINVAVTSPPYAEQRDYDKASGFVPIPPDEYVEWFAPVAANVATHLAEDGSWFVNIKPSAEDLDTTLYVFDLVLAHVREWGWHFATEFCWERNGVPKHVTHRFKNQFEPVYQFARSEWKIRPENVRHWSEHSVRPIGAGAGDWSLGQGGSSPHSASEKGRATQLGSLQAERFNGNAAGVQGTMGALGTSASGEPGWAFPGNRLPTFSGSHEALGHSAAFPVGLPAFFTRAFSDEGDVVFDPFMGSGSTLMAAEESGRIGVGIELSRGYCDVICQRYQAKTGLRPILERTGKPVDHLRASR